MVAGGGQWGGERALDCILLTKSVFDFFMT